MSRVPVSTSLAELQQSFREINTRIDHAVASIASASASSTTTGGFTARSVPFADINGNLTQDNSNFRYDSATSVLSIFGIAVGAVPIVPGFGQLAARAISVGSGALGFGIIDTLGNITVSNSVYRGASWGTLMDSSGNGFLASLKVGSPPISAGASQIVCSALSVGNGVGFGIIDTSGSITVSGSAVYRVANRGTIIDSNANLVNIGTVSCGAITATSLTTSGNINTTAGAFQINGTTVINSSRQVPGSSVSWVLPFNNSAGGTHIATDGSAFFSLYKVPNNGVPTGGGTGSGIN